MLEWLSHGSPATEQKLTRSLVPTVDPKALQRSLSTIEEQCSAVPLIDPWSNEPAAATLPNSAR